MHEKAFVNHKNFNIKIGGNLLMTCFSRCENGGNKICRPAETKPAARAMKPERQVGVKLFYRNLSLKRFTANANYLDSSVMPSMRISNRGAEITSDSWK